MGIDSLINELRRLQQVEREVEAQQERADRAEAGLDSLLDASMCGLQRQMEFLDEVFDYDKEKK